MNQQVAYQHGRFCSRAELQVAVDDPGFLLGVTISERLRTFQGQLFRVDEHLRRLLQSLKIIGLPDPDWRDSLVEICDEVVTKNMALLPAGSDLGVCVLSAPTSLNPTDRQASLTVFTYSLPFSSSAQMYRSGQRLIVTQTQQVPVECWPSELKCRSRMHYYLADREASLEDSSAKALLRDEQGFISEASTANVIVYSAVEGITSPPLEKILPGISLAVVVELAERLGVSFRYQELTVDDLLRSDEVLLCSTSPCVFPVSAINGQVIGDGGRDIFGKLISAWSDLVGVDIVAQAEQFAG